MATIAVAVTDRNSESPKNRVANAPIYVGGEVAGRTDSSGELELDLAHGQYEVRTEAFGHALKHTFTVPRKTPAWLSLPIGASISASANETQIDAGDEVQLRAEVSSYIPATRAIQYRWNLTGDQPASINPRDPRTVTWIATLSGGEPEIVDVSVTIVDTETGAWVSPSLSFEILPRTEEPRSELPAITRWDTAAEHADARLQATESEDTRMSELPNGDTGNGEVDQPRAGDSEGGEFGNGGASNGNNGATEARGGRNGNNGAGGPLTVALARAQIPPTPDQILWTTIRNRTNAIRFGGTGDGSAARGYAQFIDNVLCSEPGYIQGHRRGANGVKLARQRRELYEPVHGVGAYDLLRTATEVILLLECGTVIDDFDSSGAELYDAADEELRLGEPLELGAARELLGNYLGNDRLPYIDRVIDAAFGSRDPVNSIFCKGFLSGRASCPPMLELIWSYWHEEAMLVQTMKVLSRRFQNLRGRGEHDPLANLEIAPLYPLNNLMWGYIQDEVHHLSVKRRNYEYSHHYGIGLYGEATSDFRPADPRSRFLEGFHNLLYRASQFYKQDDDNTYNADGFPVLNALREVHLCLAEGAHNQFGDLPWTARVEMLMEQWMLARPETRLFLQSRDMVPYLESWMPQVDAMKTLQGWTDTSVTHFNFLAVHGEQLLLSIRYGDWIAINEPRFAGNWARYWRPEIQNYIHSYRAVTGVDLTADLNETRQSKLIVTQPSELLKNRLASSNGSGAPRPSPEIATTPRFRERRAERVRTNGNR